MKNNREITLTFITDTEFDAFKRSLILPVFNIYNIFN